MHASKADLTPVVFGEYEGRTVDWDSLRFAFESFPANFPPDESPFAGLPDDRCQCPHWGYLIKGSFRVTYLDGPDEIVHAGEAYHLRPGHFLQSLEPVELIELSPVRAHQVTLDQIARNLGGRRVIALGYAARAIDELPTLWDGFAKLVGSGLEITAFGVNIMDLPPDYATTAHDEAETGQQELYVALRGAGAVVIEGVAHALDAEHLVVVEAGTNRVLSSGAQGLRVLCVGGVPGAAYVPPEWSH